MHKSSRQAKQKKDAQMDSFDRSWFVLQTYSGYENKGKENLYNDAQTYNMLENILRVEIPTQNRYKLRKTVEQKKSKKTASQVMCLS